MYILTMLMASIQVFGPFMPGVTVDQYGMMIVDVNKTRAVVMSVIPQDTIKNTKRCNMVLVQFDNITKAIDEYDMVFVKQGKQNELPLIAAGGIGKRGNLAANAAAPLRTIHGTLANVSTLLMTVGLPQRPLVVG